MDSWDCCRTCLTTQMLNPIFPQPDHHEKYTNILLTAIGIKIEPMDNLPQHMCTPCINFVNNCYKFRKKCEDAQTMLLNRFNNKEYYSIKDEETYKSDEKTSIDISDFIIDNDFRDYDDNITLDTFQYYKLNETKMNEFETKVQDIEKPIEIVFNDRKRERLVKRKEKSKKEDRKKEKERTKEQIECEYCHKVLTSKLSLRNHYKIHTGFDVVCEHCGKKFITRRLLLMHCRAKHGYEKTDKCSFCDYKASNAEQVKIHERLHTGEKPYTCQECGAGFHRKSSYLQHIAIHLPEKTVQCDQCPALFKSVTLMRIHKNRHRGAQYTFRCHICDNNFARRRNAARHLQRVHGLMPDAKHIDRIKVV